MVGMIEQSNLCPDRCAPAEPIVLKLGPFVIECHTGRVESPQGNQRLRLKELELFIHLYQHVDQTFSREELLERVWKCRADLLTRTVDQTIATLRKKIELDPACPQFLQTVYGTGYRLVSPERWGNS